MTYHNENQGATVDRIIGRDTPTDDEREALTYLITAFRFRERGLRFPFHEADLAISRPLAEFLHREGFRRYEVPEPPETFADRLSARAEYELGRMAGRDELRAEQEERKKSGVWVEHAGHCNAEPQGEPSDTQVLAALNAYNDDLDAELRDWSPYKANAMRAALRAAGEVRS